MGVRRISRCTPAGAQEATTPSREPPPLLSPLRPVWRRWACWPPSRSRSRCPSSSARSLVRTRPRQPRPPRRRRDHYPHWRDPGSATAAPPTTAAPPRPRHHRRQSHRLQTDCGGISRPGSLGGRGGDVRLPVRRTSFKSGSSRSADPCAPHPARTGRHALTHGLSPPHNLCPAQPNGADPLGLLAWGFTPIFKAMFIGLALLYNIGRHRHRDRPAHDPHPHPAHPGLPGADIVSQRRMQMLSRTAGHLHEVQGQPRQDLREQMKLYRDRGVNPASGCLPALLQLVLLLPMYQVFSQGLSAPDISSMLQVFGNQSSTSSARRRQPLRAVHRPRRPWLAWLPARLTGFHMPGYPGGLPANLPEIFINAAAAVRPVAPGARLGHPPAHPDADDGDDADGRPESSGPAADLPDAAGVLADLWRLLPAGLFIYWITTTIFSIVQQFRSTDTAGSSRCSAGRPGFARDHTPRFPVKMPQPKPRHRRPTRSASRRHHTTAPATRARQAPSGRPGDGPAGEGDVDERVPGVHRQDRRGGAPERREAFGVGGLDDLDFEILTPGSRGVLGMGAEPARIIAAPRGARWRRTQRDAAVPRPRAPLRRRSQRLSRPGPSPAHEGGTEAVDGRSPAMRPTSTRGPASPARPSRDVGPRQVEAAVAAGSPPSRRDPHGAERRRPTPRPTRPGYEPRRGRCGPMVRGANDREGRAGRAHRTGRRAPSRRHIVNLMLSRRMGTWTVCSSTSRTTAAAGAPARGGCDTADNVRETGQMLSSELMEANLRDQEGSPPRAEGADAAGRRPQGRPRPGRALYDKKAQGSDRSAPVSISLRRAGPTRGRQALTYGGACSPRKSGASAVMLSRPAGRAGQPTCSELVDVEDYRGPLRAPLVRGHAPPRDGGGRLPVHPPDCSHVPVNTTYRGHRRPGDDGSERAGERGAALPRRRRDARLAPAEDDAAARVRGILTSGNGPRDDDPAGRGSR